MPDQSWLQTELGKTLITDAVAAVVSRYRIGEAAAKEAVENVFGKSEGLRKIVERESSAAKITRTRAFKDALSSVKRNVYYDLRRYSADSNNQRQMIEELSAKRGASPEEICSLALEIAESHASTRERIADREDFYRQLLSAIDSPNSILDIGSGMQPLLFPLDALDNLSIYMAADKDPVSTAAVAAYAKARGDERLVAINWDITDGWQPLVESCGVSEFDVAFLFKLVPVVGRQKPELLNILTGTPAKLWVLTGSRMSLTKRQDIEKRERAVLRRFYESAGCRVVQAFSTGEEFGLVLEKQ